MSELRPSHECVAVSIDIAAIIIGITVFIMAVGG
jgi:hypothetical protein